MMFPLHFHYEDVSRQDLLLKPNHANVMEVPGSCEIRLVPNSPLRPSSFRIQFGKLAMEIPRGLNKAKPLLKDQQITYNRPIILPCFKTKKGPYFQAGKSFRSNSFLGSEKAFTENTGYALLVKDFARQSAPYRLRGHVMSHFLVRISTVMSMLDSPVEIRENPIQFINKETDFCEFSPELEDHFEIFEHIRGFNVTIVTSANTKDETLPPWSGFLLKDEGETKSNAY